MYLKLSLISTEFFPGHFSKQEIERKVNDAEQFKNDDKTLRDRIAAKNQLESYAFRTKSIFNEDERKLIFEKCDEIIKWLDANQLAEQEEFEEKQKEIEKVCNPIITKMYQAISGAP